jgi:hypothetical protein
MNVMVLLALDGIEVVHIEGHGDAVGDQRFEPVTP